MSDQQLYIGNTPIATVSSKIEGEYVSIEGQQFFKISNYTSMRPFFMTIVSHTDLWMFISSNGGITAGRRDAESSLFPYYSDDKITDGADYTGSKTILKISKGDKTYLWEPFSDRYKAAYRTENNLYKNGTGNQLIFEEVNHDLALKFEYKWTFSEKFGIIKKSKLTNISTEHVEADLLDGIQNILPSGVGSALQNQRSTLVDAYKKCELEETGIGIYSLSAKIVDRAEPSESLISTTVWSNGLVANNTLLCSKQLDGYRLGQSVSTENDIRAERGAYFINSSFSLGSEETKSWFIISEVNQSVADLIELKHILSSNKDLSNELDDDINAGTTELRKLVGLADGIQLTNDKLSVGRHFSNTLFNIMRGGLFDDGYLIETAYLKDYISIANSEVFKRNSAFLNEMPEEILLGSLKQDLDHIEDLDLQRLIIEYLPLTFSRRHGDPSRPWNTFTIKLTDSNGKKLKSYEGNWRDIFQNWEALAYSFPQYVEGMILKFLNASTIDGYNPYRITSEGIDWEVIEEDDPWSFIGYWGDHQIIYLLRLMEVCEAHYPGKLANLLDQKVSVYANVPYRIKGYDAIIKNPSDTIDFDHKVHNTAMELTDELGSDGKLLWLNRGEIARANLSEKLLITLLTKLYNFIPDAGIWLNTQRPEWNDANNALVGNGVSMVTLYHIRRFISFCKNLFAQKEDSEVDVNKPLRVLFTDLNETFNSNELNNLSNSQRRDVMDKLGVAGETYRNSVYSVNIEEYDTIAKEDIDSFFDNVLRVIDKTIERNRREDGLYHSYNIINIRNAGVSIDYLDPMLEGQVAVLNSQYLSTSATCDVLDALKSSAMYRPDQYSYTLYPDKQLPIFIKKNYIPHEYVLKSKFLQELLDNNDRSIIEKDIYGDYHFNKDFNNAESLKRALDKYKKSNIVDLLLLDYSIILEAFEEVFQHKYFAGRSGTFYGYEGLGSIYWHMVSKLLLATQESIIDGIDQGITKTEFGRLVQHYYDIRAGIGINKSPEVYGAFPTDAYSHTPGNAGAQQPGMTGQVKEDVINRWAELGVKVNEGKISFAPYFLSDGEYLNKEEKYHYFDLNGKEQEIEMNSGSLAFTYCGVPVKYALGSKQQISMEFKNGSSEVIMGNTLSKEISEHIFSRNGEVQRIVFEYEPENLKTHIDSK